MIARASAKFVRISPRKVRYVIDLIRRKSVPQAQGILGGAPRRAAQIVQKLLNQAVDAAEKNSKIQAKDLVISKVMADGGPSMRRFRAASMGRASLIKKRTSHIHLELDMAKPGRVPAPPKAAGKAAPKKKEAKKLVGAR